MNRDDVIRMAREAGLSVLMPDEHVEGIGGIYIDSDENCLQEMERFAALVADAARGDYQEGWEEGYKAGVLAEREECAELCELYDGFDGNGVCLDCARAIRTRGNS